MIEWAEYERRFRVAVAAADYRRRFDEAYVSRCLEYAERLHSQQLPIIYDQEHLARLVGYKLEFLLAVSNAPDKFYRSFSVPKVRGGMRLIDEPLPSLKEVQRWILDNVLSQAPVSRFAKGFLPGRSIRDNARYHVGRQQLLTVDIADFFGSIRIPRIIGLLRRFGYSRPLAVLVAKLCTLRGVLPQGAPTSPAFSNLVSERMDERLSGYAMKRRIRYTRYADDLSFSGEFDAGELIKFVRTVLSSNGLVLNETKTRLMRRHQRQETTGIVVNEKMNATRELRRAIRQQLYFISKFGLDSHLARTRNVHASYLRHLLGQASFALFVNPRDEALRTAVMRLKEQLRISDTASDSAAD